MASKIFMGDMPELMENILNNLNNEFDSLFSCVLVSRHWCKASVPILWQDPFSFENKPLFISKYFSSLGEDEKFGLKECLKECEINTEFSKTLFDYARFLKVLDLPRLKSKVKKWLYFQLDNLISNFDYYSLVHHIIKLLFKLFIESGATLHKLNLEFSDYGINPEIFYSLGQSVLFFSQLQDLSLNITFDFSIENAIALLKTLAKNTTKINALKLSFGVYSGHEPQLFNILTCIIKSQDKIRQFSLTGGEELTLRTEFYGIISALESQENSLQEVRIENCAYGTEFEILKNCKKLEILRMIYCDYPKILNYKISTLEIACSQIDASTLVQILKESGILLQRLKFESVDYEFLEESLLLKALKSFCPNIIYLNIFNIRVSTQLLELIGNLQKLQFLSLWSFVDDIPEEERKMRVMQFAEILPLTLQYLDLWDDMLDSYIDVLLNHCNAPLKKLLIYSLHNEKIAKAIIEFCIRYNTLNYVGVFRKLDFDDDIGNEVEAYVALVPYTHIVVDC